MLRSVFVAITAAVVVALSSPAGGTSCPADVTQDQRQDIFDVLEFFRAFGAGEPQADFAMPSPQLDVFDVLGFFEAFATGCRGATDIGGAGGAAIVCLTGTSLEDTGDPDLATSLAGIVGAFPIVGDPDNASLVATAIDAGSNASIALPAARLADQVVTLEAEVRVSIVDSSLGGPDGYRSTTRRFPTTPTTLAQFTDHAGGSLSLSISSVASTGENRAVWSARGGALTGNRFEVFTQPSQQWLPLDQWLVLRITVQPSVSGVPGTIVVQTRRPDETAWTERQRWPAVVSSTGISSARMGAITNATSGPSVRMLVRKVSLATRPLSKVWNGQFDRAGSPLGHAWDPATLTSPSLTIFREGSPRVGAPGIDTQTPGRRAYNVAWEFRPDVYGSGGSPRVRFVAEPLRGGEASISPWVTPDSAGGNIAMAAIAGLVPLERYAVHAEFTLTDGGPVVRSNSSTRIKVAALGGLAGGRTDGAATVFATGCAGAAWPTYAYEGMLADPMIDEAVLIDIGDDVSYTDVLLSPGWESWTPDRLGRASRALLKRAVFRDPLANELFSRSALHIAEGDHGHSHPASDDEGAGLINIRSRAPDHAAALLDAAYTVLGQWIKPPGAPDHAQMRDVYGDVGFWGDESYGPGSTQRYGDRDHRHYAASVGARTQWVYMDEHSTRTNADIDGITRWQLLGAPKLAWAADQFGSHDLTFLVFTNNTGGTVGGKFRSSNLRSVGNLFNTTASTPGAYDADLSALFDRWMQRAPASAGLVVIGHDDHLQAVYPISRRSFEVLADPRAKLALTTANARSSSIGLVWDERARVLFPELVATGELVVGDRFGITLGEWARGSDGTGTLLERAKVDTAKRLDTYNGRMPEERVLATTFGYARLVVDERAGSGVLTLFERTSSGREFDVPWSAGYSESFGFGRP